MGFRNVRAIVDNQLNGRHWLSTFRKVPSQASTAGQWVDLSMAAGFPVPNYYASEPLVAATISSTRGLAVGSDTGAATKHLSNLVIMTPTANAVPSTWVVCDYLLYYPFIDMDDSEPQSMTNTVTLPRYTTGEGVMAMMVNVAPPLGLGSFEVLYTNSQGVSDRLITAKCNTSTYIASLTTSGPAITGGNSFSPYLAMASGDRGIRSVQSVKFLVPNGGLASLVLVKPLFTISLAEITAPTEVPFNTRTSLPRIYDGACLNMIGHSITGSVAGAVITGYSEVIW